MTRLLVLIFITLLMVQSVAKPEAHAWGLNIFNRAEQRQFNEEKQAYLLELKEFLFGYLKAQDLDSEKRLLCLSGQTDAPRAAQLFQGGDATAFCHRFIYGEMNLESNEAVGSIPHILRLYTALREKAALARVRLDIPEDVEFDKYGLPLFFRRAPDVAHLFDRIQIPFLAGKLPQIPSLSPLTELEVDRISKNLTSQLRYALKKHYDTSLEDELGDLTSKHRRLQAENEVRFAKGEITERQYQQTQTELSDYLNKQRETFEEFQSGFNTAGLHSVVFQEILQIEKDSEASYQELASLHPILILLEIDSSKIDPILRNDFDPGDYIEEFREAILRTNEIRQRLMANLADLSETTKSRDLLFLVGLRGLFSQFNSIKKAPVDDSAEFDEFVSRINAQYERSDFNKELRLIAGKVGASFLCGLFILTPQGRALGIGTRFLIGRTLLCALGTGIAFNIPFYRIADRKYIETYIQLFSSTGLGAEEGVHVLQEMSKLTERQKNIVWEVIFLPVGSGAGETLRALRISSRAQQAILRMSR